MMDGLKRSKHFNTDYINRIKKRVKQLKSRQVLEIGDDATEKERVFRYIIMNLPVAMISTKKLQEMEAKVKDIIGFIRIRKAAEDDITDLCKLYNTAFFQCPDPYRPVSVEDMKKIFENSTILIANIYKTDAAFIVLKIENDIEDSESGKHVKKIGVIAGIAVHPHYRRRGIATALGLATWDCFKKENLDLLQCEVYEDNIPSLSFITWLGFRPAGELIIKAPTVEHVNPLERI
ncbi:MAG: GNAT family N-acetyltransferase [Promethearchaeota archaeon]